MFRLALAGFCLFANTPSVLAADTLTKIGDTRYISGDCYELTEADRSESGAIWSTTKVDVTSSFTFSSSIYLGTRDYTGADGIAFSLQSNSGTQTFSTGGRWYASIPHSLVVEVDTWYNSEANINDITRSDHVHLTATTSGGGDWSSLSNEVPISNIEDGQYHSFVISWDNDSKLFTVVLDGSTKISETLSSGIAPYLNGETEAWYGFTAATGWYYNSQRVCFSDESMEEITESPTPSPTSSPTYSPTPALTETSTEIVTPPGTFGDPHFTTWTGERYDFHGACDLVLLQKPGSDNGAGMDIHIRTKFVQQWSYIASAVLRIGDETLEVMGGEKNQYWINKVEGEDLDHGISGFPITFEEVNSMSRQFRVALKDDMAILFKTFRNFVRVDVEGGKSDEFSGSYGLMGDIFGRKVARDFKTIIDEDIDAFGLEWQVLETEPMLFHSVEGVQAPERCALSSAASRPKRRRLGEKTISIKDAEAACAGVIVQDQDACIFDVLATNSKDMASAY